MASTRLVLPALCREALHGECADRLQQTEPDAIAARVGGIALDEAVVDEGHQLIEQITVR